VQKGREGENDSDPPISKVVPAAAREGDAPPLFLKCQKSSQHYSKFLGVYFVNFKLFNVIFVYF
jgi:hypothetical protein